MAEDGGGAGQQERAHLVGGAHPRRSVRCEPCAPGACATLRLEPAPSKLKKFDPTADAKRRYHHRSDRRQANSVTLKGERPVERMESCRAVRIWGLGKYRNKPACRCAVCSLSGISAPIAIAKWIEIENQFKPLIGWGVPVEWLGITAITFVQGLQPVLPAPPALP